ncbi:hypothetical protein HDU82_002815 [Entophlyctis luteolus]|nr:hypothetical protein HDU82_002815 [Entophlyctis luteolus]
MPSCDKFRQTVLECLSESDCVAKRGLSLNECLDLKNKDVSAECRLAQMNPRRRLRGAYGSDGSNTHPKSDDEDFKQ